MNRSNRRNFSPEFKLEAAQLVIERHYTAAAASTAMNVGKSTMDKRVRRLKEKRAGKSSKVSPMTLEQIEMCELKKDYNIFKLKRYIKKGYCRFN